MTKRRRFTAGLQGPRSAGSAAGRQDDPGDRSQAQSASEPSEQLEAARRWRALARCFRTASTVSAGIMNQRSASFTPRSGS